MKESIQKILLAALLGLSSIAPVASFSTHYITTQIEISTDFEDRILQSINSDTMYSHIHYLSKKPRVAGSPQEKVAVRFIKQQLKSYGYKTEVQTFPFKSYIAPHTMELSIDSFSKDIQPLSMEYSIDGHVSGEVILAGRGKVAELEHLNLTGKIALLERGDISFADKVLNVTAKGAIGAIIYNHESSKIGGSLGSVKQTSIPTIFLSKEDGELLAAHTKSTPTTNITLKIEGSETKLNTSQNVIATKSPTKKTKNLQHEIIVIGSHHDSVAGAPGANDNASGIAMTLELARIFKNIPTDTEIRFIAFGAEEAGLIGSTHYIDQLSKDEVGRIVANFNLDMVGSKDAGELIMQTVDEKPNLVTELAQAASTQLNGTPTPYNQGESSDHASFAKVGIPAALFIHNPTEPWYHTKDDNIDKISKEKLQDVAEIVSLSIWNQIRIDLHEE